MSRGVQQCFILQIIRGSEDAFIDFAPLTGVSNPLNKTTFRTSKALHGMVQK